MLWGCTSCATAVSDGSRGLCLLAGEAGWTRVSGPALRAETAESERACDSHYRVIKDASVAL